MYEEEKKPPYGESGSNKKQPSFSFSGITDKWKRNKKTPNQESEEFDALAELSTLDQKSASLRKKTISRFVYTMGFLSIGLFIISGLIKFAFIMSKGENRKPIATKVKDVKLEINSFSKWQTVKDEEITELGTKIVEVNKDLTKKIENSRKEFKKDLNTTTSLISDKIDENQKSNVEFVNSLVSQIKKEIRRSEKSLKGYTDSKNLSVEEKIEKIKKEAYAKNSQSKKGLDFSKLSLPSLPSLGKKGSSSAKAGTLVSSNNKNEEVEEETIVIEEAISAPESSTISTLVKEEKKTNKNNIPPFFVMPGFTKGTIITGADVPTFAEGTNAPKPIWISVTGDTLIANNDIMNVDECILQAAATGDFASGVAEVRLSQISCSATDDMGKKYKIFTKIKGWAYGENGKYGIKGRLVSKEGQIISKALPLTAIEGLIGILANVGNSNLVNTGTTVNAGQAMGNAVSNSSGKVLGKISDYYLKLLDSLNPIIEVKAGREVTLAFQGGETLQFEEYTPADIDFFDNEKRYE